MATRANRGAVEYTALADALDSHTPPCTGDPRFLLEPQEIARQELARLALICQDCPVSALCRAYGDTARPPAGVWAGRTYRPSRGRTRKEDKQ